MATSSPLNNKKFVNGKNTANGEVTGDTVFHYQQSGSEIEATYSGGSIRKGHLMGVMTSDSTFTMVYHHVNEANELRVGQCRTSIAVDQDGKLRLIESWQWLNGDCSTGESLLLEV